MAVSDTYSLDEDSLFLRSAPGLLENDSDAPGSVLTAQIETPPALGTLILNLDGSFSYQPPANFHGTVSFSYRVSDGSLLSTPASVTLNVLPVNDPPLFTSNPIVENALAGSPFLSELNALDPDENTLVFSKVTGPEWLVVTEDGTLTGLPANSDAGANVFTVAVTDTGTPGLGDGASAVATLQINVSPTGPTLTSFLSTHFTPAELTDPLLSSPAADPDRDGVPNLLEYAFAQNPRVPSVANLPAPLLVPAAAETFVGLRFVLLKEAFDLTYTPEFSSEPASGFTATPNLQISLIDNGDGTETLTLRDTVPVTPSAPRFVRLRVDQN